MQPSPATNPPPQARDAVALLRERLGKVLLAAYLYGSFVDGGLQPASDLDLLVVLRRPLQAGERERVMAGLLALSSPPGDPRRRALEVTCVVQADVEPWRHPAMRELQFGEWLRDDLLAGQVAGREPDPDLALLLAQARANGITLHGPLAAALLPDIPAADIRAAIQAMLHGVAAHLAGEEKHALLTLARMWVTLRTGAIVSKRAAVALVAPQLPLEHRGALERALAVYRGDIADDWHGWEDRVAHCAGHMVDALECAGVLAMEPAVASGSGHAPGE